MGYLLGFGLAYIGYAVLDHAHYVWNHQPKSLWYLISGMGPSSSTPTQPTQPTTQPKTGPQAPLI